MKKCSYCGSENEDSGKFCRNCGAELPKAVEPEVAEVISEPVTVIEPIIAKPVSEPVAAQTVMPDVEYGQAKENTNNGLCVAGLIVSIASIFCCGITAFIGLILSIIGLVSVKKTKQKGKGMAIAGIIISVVATIIGFIFSAAGGTSWVSSLVGQDTRNTKVTEEDDGDADEIKDAITGENWVEMNSGSYLVFNSSKKFTYFKDYGVSDNYYYEGKYELYVGDEALEYITDDLSEYDIDEDDIEDLMDENKNYDISNLVCLVLKNNKQIIDGENQLDDTVVTPYYGFYVDAGDTFINLTHMETNVKYLFVPEDDYEPVVIPSYTMDTEPVETSAETSGTSSETTAETSAQTSAQTSETTGSATALTVIGNDIVGHVPVTYGNWVSWTEAGGYDPTITSHEAAMNTATGSIINIQVWDTDVTPEAAAQGIMQNMEVNGHASGVTGAQVTIGGQSAVQAYGLYPDGQYLVCWFFRTPDNVFHYISVEFKSTDYNCFSMVEDNYTLN